MLTSKQILTKDCLRYLRSNGIYSEDAIIAYLKEKARQEEGERLIDKQQ